MNKDFIMTETDCGLWVEMLIHTKSVDKRVENGEKRDIYAQNLWITLWKVWIFGWKPC